MAGWFSNLQTLLGPATSPGVEFLAIVVGTFILEDATTILCAMATADGRLPVALALGGLYAGIALGDIGLFALGRLAGQHPWARRFVAMERVQAVRAWMDHRLITAVISTRFMPGARLPTYTACGFLGLSFSRFAFAVVCGTLAWTTLLFVAALLAGGLIMRYLGTWRWPAGLALALLVLVVGHLLARRRGSRVADGEA